MAGFQGSAPRVLGGLFVVALSFWVTLLVLDHLDRGKPNVDRTASQSITPTVAAPTEDQATFAARAARPSSLRDLPKRVPGFPFDAVWDGIEGLNVQSIGPAVVPGGSSSVSLVAVSDADNHRLGIQFSGLPAGQGFTMSLWLSASAGGKILVDVRDGFGKEGTPRNQGAAAFDLANRAVLSSSGAIQRVAAETAPGGWVKISGQMLSADGRVVIYIGLKGASAAGAAGGALQHLVLGGIALAI